MTYLELQDEVKLKLQDSSKEIVNLIPALINEVIEEDVEAAGPREFMKYGSITTSTSNPYVDLSSAAILSDEDFSGRLLECADADENLVEIVSLEALFTLFPAMDTSGSVEYVAVEGNILYYQRIPSTAATLYILYRRKPTAMSEDDDTPDGIPEYLHRPLIVPGAAKKGFSLIEDGIEDSNKPNTFREMQAHDKAFLMYKEWVERRKRHLPRSFWKY